MGSMKVLVTGGTGFLGRRLVQQLLEEGEEVWTLARTSQAAAPLQSLGARVISGDVRRWSSLRRAVQGMEAIFHCAGKVEPTGRWVDFLEVNVLGTERLILAAVEHGVRRIIHVSSIGIYGPQSTGAMISEHSGYDPNPGARGFYTRSKIEAEALCLEYAGRGGDVTVLRPMSLFGPHMSGVFVLLFDWVHRGRPVYLLGKGRNRVQMVSAWDVADACRLAANAVCIGDTLVMSACGPRLRAELEGRGYAVVTVPLGSFLRSGGAAFCLTLRLDLQSDRLPHTQLTAARR